MPCAGDGCIFQVNTFGFFFKADREILNVKKKCSQNQTQSQVMRKHELGKKTEGDKNQETRIKNQESLHSIQRLNKLCGK